MNLATLESRRVALRSLRGPYEVPRSYRGRSTDECGRAGSGQRRRDAGVSGGGEAGGGLTEWAVSATKLSYLTKLWFGRPL